MVLAAFGKGVEFTHPFPRSNLGFPLEQLSLSVFRRPPIQVGRGGVSAVVVLSARFALQFQEPREQRDRRRRQRWRTRLPDGYRQIFRLYVFGPSGLKDDGSATLRCKM